jgi:serine/threonine protein kinase
LHSLSHPNIVTVREVLHLKQRDAIYIITNLANCGSLNSILAAGVLTPIAIQYIFKCLTAAVSYLHSQNLIHQDIKPANVLLSNTGGVFLTDFGLSHSFNTPSTVFASPLYSAPESLDPVVDTAEESRSKEDIWSLGVTLYEMLFGQTPFKGRDVYEIIAAIHETQLEPKGSCDKAAWELITKMLRVNPKERFGINDVLASEYVRSAPMSMDLGFLRAMELPVVDADRPIVEETAVQCGPEYRLEQSVPKLQTHARSLPFYHRRPRSASCVGIDRVRLSK